MRATPSKHVLSRAAVAAVLLGSIDAVATRLGQPHRTAEIATFVGSAALWFTPALVTTAVLCVVARRMTWLRARADEATPSALVVTACAAAPVLMHASLNAYTSIGGNLTGLSSPEPWLLGLGLVALALALALVSKRFLAPRATFARAAFAAAVLVGAFLPRGGITTVARPEAPSGAPNLLLLVWDTARAQSFSFLRGPRDTTPALAELAQHALVFENARSVTHFTFTSHLSMLTGRYPTEHGARLLDTRHVPEVGGETLAQELQRAGYRTGAFVGTGVLRAETGISAGFDAFDDMVDPAPTYTYLWALVHDVQALLIHKRGLGWNNGEPHWIQDFQRPGGDVLARATKFIERKDERPWFVLVNLFDVHWPYTPSEAAAARFATQYAGVVSGYASRANSYPEEHTMDAADDAHLLSLYESEFADLDAEVATFMNSLHLETSNTAVLMTADHGEAFGEGGRYEHEDILEPQVHVPLVLRLPGASPRAGRIAAPVSGIDVAPTLRSLAGLPALADAPGLDLSRTEVPMERVVYVEDRDHHDAEKAQFAAYSGSFKLVWLDALHNDSFELYDLETDPIGLVDRTSEHRDVASELRRRLKVERSWLPLDRFDRPGGSIDVEALRALGYLGERK